MDGEGISMGMRVFVVLILVLAILMVAASYNTGGFTTWLEANQVIWSFFATTIGLMITVVVIVVFRMRSSSSS